MVLHCGLKLVQCLIPRMFCSIIPSSDESDVMFSESDYEL